VATFAAASHELLRLWLHLPLQAEVVAMDFHAKFENSLITQQKETRVTRNNKTSNQQDF
jgi:hypothetical protein